MASLSLRGHTGNVLCLALSPGSNPTQARVASGGEDGVARIWCGYFEDKKNTTFQACCTYCQDAIRDVGTGKCVRGLRNDTQGQDCASLCWQGEDLVYASFGPEIKLFDLRTNTSPVLMNAKSICARPAEDDINNIAVNERGTFLTTADDSGAIVVTDLRTNRPFKRFRSGHNNLATSVRFHPTRPWEVWSSSMDCTVRRWDFSRGSVTQAFNLAETEIPQPSPTSQTINPPFVHALEFHPPTGIAAAGLGDGSIALFSPPSPQPQSKRRKNNNSNNTGDSTSYSLGARLEGGHTWAVTALTFPRLAPATGMPRLISGSLDGSLLTWAINHSSSSSSSTSTIPTLPTTIPKHRVTTTRKIDCMAALPPMNDESVVLLVGGPLNPSSNINGTPAPGGLAPPRDGDIEAYIVQL
ncbi:WD40-repeat-containing domain protein [Powellomyces hirtus]|nr:WD40-repeat-containing domain protein [Powellomyces hirtus]KAI8912999.1 WD40-repeat-containing domain protein [Powellomyces hirtus]